MNRDLILTVLVCLSAAAPCTHAQTVVYVDANAVGDNDGSSWANARIDLQIALGFAVPGDEFWVANGTYKPTPGFDRSVSFSLASDVGILGGFEGVDSINFPGGETQRDQRNTDPATNGTVLSGDIGSPGDNSDNSFHVVTGGGTDATAVLDGFTIKAGNANGSSFPDDSGGGVFNLAGSPTLKNCLIKENAALQRGGGMFTGVSELGAVFDPQLINCTFDNNSAIGGGGGLFNGNLENFADTSRVNLTDCTFSGNSALGGPGGGMIDFAATSTLTNCSFVDNFAAFWGGGLSNGKGFFNSAQRLVGCTFIGNVSDNRGGGMYSAISATATLTNCTFIGNISNHGGGGGVFNRHSSQVDLINCTFIGNRADTNRQGGAIKSVNSTIITLTNCTFVDNVASTDDSGGGLRLSTTATAEVLNCIFWRNSSMGGLMDEAAQIDNAGTGTVTVDHSLIQGLDTFAGPGNIDFDPLFVDADGLDGIPGTADANLLLSSSSPCIDAGDNSAPFLLIDPDDVDGNMEVNEPLPIDTDGIKRRFNDPFTTDCQWEPFTCGTEPIVDMGAREFFGAVFTDEGINIEAMPVDAATGDMPVTLTFDEVTEGGVTSLEISSMGQPPPSGLQLGMPATFYELSTTAQFDGAVEICIDYTGVSYGVESMLKLEHLEDGMWVDVTTSLDTVNKIICGSVTFFSSFAVFEPEEPGVLIEALITQIDALDIPHGIQNSLTQLLAAAIMVLSDSNPNNDGAAVNLLDAFVHHVEAQSGNHITEEDAGALIEAAIAIQGILTSS